MKPKVSIILPTYNGEKYIKKSIDSIVNQTFSDWELIIVDDCSSDRTYSVIEQYTKQDKRIHIIKNSINQKLPKALNIGFASANGEYLTWTSDDNLYKKNALEVMSKELDQRPEISLVYAGMTNIDEYENILSIQKQYPEKMLMFTNVIGACFMYRKEVYKKLGEYDSQLFLVEDYDYWLRIFENYNIMMIKENLYYYRRHSESLTETKKNNLKLQLKKLKYKHINNLLELYQKDKKSVVWLYYDWIEHGYDPKRIQNIVWKYVPEIKNEKDLDIDKKVIIFGAGNIGCQAIEFLKDRVIQFVDNDSQKWGKTIKNLRVTPVEKLSEKEENIDIVIALSPKYILEAVLQLNKIGIKKYTSFYHIVYVQNKLK
ncbi:MAG: glycosyltransferase [Lachnospiraceae bacterium]|nr:glycosyltransferase [Lachnospiraceae bacterium]